MIIDQKTLEHANALISLLLSQQDCLSGHLLETLNLKSLDSVFKLLDMLEVPVQRDADGRISLHTPNALLDLTEIERLVQSNQNYVVGSLQYIVNSTNQVLLDSNFLRPMEVKVSLAEAQIGGRGRRGKGWMSPFARNIYLSFGYQKDVDQLDSRLPLRVAVAIRNMLMERGINEVQIKWPNDILVNGRKLGGILVESKITAEFQVVVIGLGLNCYIDSMLKEQVDQPITSIQEITDEQVVDRNLIAGQIINALLHMLKFPMTDDKLFDEWSRSDYMLGKKVGLNTPDRKVVGVARGLGANGGYLIETERGMLTVDSSHSGLRLIA
jgi:BirA family biotin operon repressor/biotin-[acetyl-CoA-carboxylase] ligase